MGVQGRAPLPNSPVPPPPLPVPPPCHFHWLCRLYTPYGPNFPFSFPVLAELPSSAVFSPPGPDAVEPTELVKMVQMLPLPQKQLLQLPHLGGGKYIQKIPFPEARRDLFIHCSSSPAFCLPLAVAVQDSTAWGQGFLFFRCLMSSLKSPPLPPFALFRKR